MYNNTIVNKKNFYANKEGRYDYDDDGDNILINSKLFYFYRFINTVFFILILK
jgi:hypothetical protein